MKEELAPALEEVSSRERLSLAPFLDQLEKLLLDVQEDGSILIDKDLISQNGKYAWGTTSKETQMLAVWKN